jgi:hypothetical protein
MHRPDGSRHKATDQEGNERSRQAPQGDRVRTLFHGSILQAGGYRDRVRFMNDP